MSVLSGCLLINQEGVLGMGLGFGVLPKFFEDGRNACALQSRVLRNSSKTNMEAGLKAVLGPEVVGSVKNGVNYLISFKTPEKTDLAIWGLKEPAKPRFFEANFKNIEF